MAAAGTLTVIHRPILGITGVTNPEPTSFGGESETDDALRRRARRALDVSGGGTTGAIIGALASVEGIRDQDVRVTEDHVGFPGVVKVTVAVPDLDEARTRRGHRAPRRPSGRRACASSTTSCPRRPPIADPGLGGGADDGPPVPTTSIRTQCSRSIGVAAAVTPRSASLSADEKAALVAEVEQVIRVVRRHPWRRRARSSTTSSSPP